MTNFRKLFYDGNVCVKSEERNNKNRGKFRHLSRHVSGEVFDVPENNEVLFLYKEDKYNQVLAGQLSFSYADATLTQPSVCFDSEFYPLITFLFVNRDFQDQGYGRLLVGEALKLINSKNNHRPVRLQSAEDATGFFEKCGFQVVGEPIKCFNTGPRLFRTLVNMEYNYK